MHAATRRMLNCMYMDMAMPMPMRLCAHLEVQTILSGER